jgi:hypothetical protein
MSVQPEADTTLKYLSPVLPNQPDSGDRWHGQKTHLVCQQFDYTFGIDATSFAARVDVTGATNGEALRRVGRSHRSELRGRHVVSPLMVDVPTFQIAIIRGPSEISVGRPLSPTPPTKAVLPFVYTSHRSSALASDRWLAPTKAENPTF